MLTFLINCGIFLKVITMRYEEPECPALGSKPVPQTAGSVARQLLNLLGLKQPTPLSATIAKSTILIFFILALATCAVLRWESAWSAGGVALAALGAALVAALLVLCRQPRHSVRHLSFTVPLVPLVPYLSVCMNVYLMAQLDYQTWVRFIIWLVIGYLIYFIYGIRNSSLVEKDIPVTTNGKADEKHQITTKF